MDVLERIRQLVAIMAENELAELEVEEPELRVRIRTSQGMHNPAHPSGIVTHQVAQVPAGQQPAQSPEQKSQAAPAPAPQLAEIRCPMVGTFYRAPSDGAEPYVTVGSVVDSESVVCIVEAMKVMNEVKAEVEGEVVEVLVQNGEPVEFGQVLFLVKPLRE